MSPAALDKLRILIVDDEPGALNALGDIFEDKEYIVTKAASGRQAREALDHQEYDVALLDIRLPDARGTDLLKEIRQHSDTTRCIMITASPEAEDAITALNDGASAYIPKPINVGLVMQKIEEVVAKYRKTVEERRKLQDLDIVRSVGEAAMDLDLDRLLNGVLRAVVDGFQADSGAILLCDADDTALSGAAQLNLSPRDIHEYHVKVGSGFSGRVAAARRVLSVEDVRSATYDVAPYLKEADVSSLLGAPIMSAKGVIGVLLIAWRDPRAFTAADNHLLGVLAQRLGLATVNAQLYAQEDASKRRAEYLARVSQELNSHIGDVHQVVERVTRLATERLGDGCAIFLKEPGSDTLEAILSYHRNAEKQAVIEAHLRDQPVRLGEGAIGRVAETGQSVVVAPGTVLDAYPERKYLSDVGIASSISVPLRAHGEVIGVMSVSITESDRRYTDEDLALAQEFADRAAVAVENASLLREAQEKRQELQALFEMTRTVTSSLQETEVLEALLMGAGDLMSAPACCIATYHGENGVVEVNEEVGITHEGAGEIMNLCVRTWYRQMLQNGEPFAIPDLWDVPSSRIAEAARRNMVRSMLSVPFEVEGRGDGVLVAFSHQKDSQLLGQYELLKTLGGLSGVALTNARSYKREWKIAERLQQWILSTEANVDLAGLEIASDYHAALNEASVGGDFFDIFRLAPGLCGIVIGDVSGKGLEAALHTQAVKHTLRAYALNSESPHEVLTRTNDAVCFMLPSDIFITLFYAVIDVRTRVLRYANAGHDAPLLCHADSSVESFESTGRALGLLSGANYTEFVHPLVPGDVLLLYTDGVTEARHNGSFLESEGVIELLRKHAPESADEIVKGIYHDVEEYTEGNTHDDIALLALKVPVAE